jgi:uncharacterized membrane protein (TIGR02234 family)
MADGRRLFVPTVLLGLTGSGLAALAGAKPWAAPDSRAGSALVDHSAGHVPLAGALGLVALACWGVVLVTRRRVRRSVAALGAVVAVGLVVTVVLGRASALDSARAATLVLGEGGTSAHVTGWWWAALVGSLLALAASVLALRFCAAWPEMGSRYDAPAARPPTEDLDDLDLWRAIDQGRDPTDPADH